MNHNTILVLLCGKGEQMDNRDYRRNKDTDNYGSEVRALAARYHSRCVLDCAR